jgi:hypothetical protein
LDCSVDGFYQWTDLLRAGDEVEVRTAVFLVSDAAPQKEPHFRGFGGGSFSP